MAEKRDIHVVPHQNGWAVRKEGASRASSVRDTKAKAMTEGKALAKRDQVELIAHAENGRVQNPNSYGRDPNPPKDKRR